MDAPPILHRSVISETSLPFSCCMLVALQLLRFGCRRLVALHFSLQERESLNSYIHFQLSVLVKQLRCCFAPPSVRNVRAAFNQFYRFFPPSPGPLSQLSPDFSQVCFVIFSQA